MSRKLTKRAVIKCRGLENLPRKIYAQPWRLSNANANTNFRCVLDEVLSCSRSFWGGWWWWVGWIGKWVGEHSSRLVKNFFATLDDQPGQPEQPGQPGHAARQLASHFECFFGDSCLPKAVSSFSFTCWHFVSIALEDSFRPEKGKRWGKATDTRHGNSCKGFPPPSSLRLSAKSYANIMFAFSTLYLTCLTSLFVFLRFASLRRCS